MMPVALVRAGLLDQAGCSKPTERLGRQSAWEDLIRIDGTGGSARLEQSTNAWQQRQVRRR